MVPPGSASPLVADYRILLPFDPRRSPHLVLYDFDFKTPSRVNHLIGIKNLTPGTVFYAHVPGMARTQAPNRAQLSASITRGSEFNAISIPREASQILLPLEVPTPVKVGTPLLSIGDKTSDSFAVYDGTPQAIFTFSLDGAPATDGTLKNLLAQDGKVLFIG